LAGKLHGEGFCDTIDLQKKHSRAEEKGRFMPDVATVLRSEISRLARKETRQVVVPIKKQNAELRRTVSALKKEVAALRNQVSFLQQQEKRRLETVPVGQPKKAEKAIRFAPRWVKADRQRLGLSAKDYGALVGVSALTVYSWEAGKSKPRKEKLAAWAEVRGLGKREAKRRLELLQG
jgi:DNA-binding transcriptional regulator YiaG